MVFENRKEIERSQFQNYLEYKDKAKRCLQFRFRFLFECLVSLAVSCLIVNYDARNLVHYCSRQTDFILTTNLFTNFVLYFKFILFVYLRLFNKSDKVFQYLLVLLTIIFVGFINSGE